jgi:uncharacterized protein YeaC (DUF1315 family)
MPMNIEQTLAALTPELVERFRTAIETGRWPNGERVSDEQRATCLQAVLIWEHHHLSPEQRTGYIDRGSKAEDEACDTHPHGHPDDDRFAEKPLRLV